MPQDRRKKTTVLTHHIGAKVTKDVFDIVEAAAQIRAKPRSWVVELGALKAAEEILAQATHAYAVVRKSIRSHKASKAGVARHAKR